MRKSKLKHKLILAMAAATLSTACAGNATPAKPGNQRTPQNAKAIAQIESGLRPTYGTTEDPVPIWSLSERMVHYKVPAMSIAVLIDGKLAWARAYGEAEKGSNRPIDTKTLFQAASLSKPVAAIAALRLVDQGKLDLDLPVNRYLRSWKIPENEFTKQHDVTLRHLLSHRAGTNIHGFRGYKPGSEIPTSVQILNGGAPSQTEAVTVNQIPGASYRYSGGGYQIVQVLLEDITGRPYRDFAEESVFRPLGLMRSNFVYPQADPNTAVGHVGESSDPIPPPGYIFPELAAAGLWTTPSDLVRLGAEVAKSRNKGAGLLSKGLAQQLVPLSASNPGLGFGLTDAGDGLGFVHGGHNTGFSAYWYNYADGRASVAILTNSDSGEGLIREVLSAVGYTYGWKQRGYIERKTIVLDQAWAEAIAGDYAFDQSSTTPVVSITLESGKLWQSGELAERTRFYAASKKEFFITKGLNFKVDTDEKGSVVALDVEGEIRLVRLKK
jgi:CubicO group peptidase (beta-lactamase class C family)